MDKPKKTKTEIEIDTFKVLACKDKELESFVNVFHFTKENLAESQLGEIFGIIKIFDHSEQSAYLPNLIAQIINKEFYSNTKISTEKAFENSLKKANVALSDLARHEIVSWMKKFHAVIGVIQNDNLFFTKVSGGKIILLRGGKINDISRGFGESDTEHPVKTFSDISSGSLFVNDKIIFATESLLESLTWEDLKRHAKTFNSSEFDNLIKSTLELEGENVGIVVTNIKEKVIIPVATLPKTKSSKAYNFFGNKKAEKEKEMSKKASEKEEPAVRKIADDKGEENKKEKQKEEKNDESLSPFDQQPELYIKEGDPIDFEHQKPPANMFGKFKEVIRKTKSSEHNENKIIKNNEGDVKEDTKKIGNTKIAGLPEKKGTNTAVLKKDSSTTGKMILLPDNGNLEKNKKNDQKSKTAKRPYPVTTAQEPKQKELSSRLEKYKKESDHDVDIFRKQTVKRDTGQAKKIDLKQIKTELKRDFERSTAKITKKEWFIKLLPKKHHFEKGKELLASCIKQYSKELEILKQKRRDSKLTFTDFLKSRYIFSTIIITIIFVLLLALFFQKSPPKYSEIENRIQEDSQQRTTNGDVYISEEEVKATLIGETNSEIIDIAGYKNNIYVITQDNSFYQYDSNINEFGGVPISDEISDVVAIVPMPDLNLIFFVSNNSVHSFSPVMKRSDRHSIKIPANSDIIGVGTYLTFLYILDKNSGQIYRYPRAEGGFGSSIKWFSSEITTDNITDIAIDDSIRVAYSDGSIEQYFKRKLVDSFLIDTQPKVVPKKIQTCNGSSYYYILDNENPRVVKIGKDDNKLKDQFWNRQFEDAKDFWIHDDKEGYVITKHNKILQFKLQ